LRLGWAGGCEEGLEFGPRLDLELWKKLIKVLV
jgi:hypothetical protein